MTTPRLTLRLKIDNLNRSLEKKYRFESNSLDQYSDIRHFRSIHSYMNYIRPVLDSQTLNEYSIVRVENRFLTNCESLEDTPVLIDDLYERYTKIVNSRFYIDYMDVIETKLLEYAKHVDMVDKPTIDDIDTYMGESPKFDWSTTLHELFEPMIDPYVLLLLHRLTQLEIGSR